MKNPSCLIAQVEPIELDRVVKTDNALINAAWGLGERQSKLVYIVASRVKISDADFTEYTFEAGELLTAMGVTSRDSKAYAELRKLTRSLIREPLEFRDGKSLIQASWFCTAIYEEGGKVKLQFAPRLKKHYVGLIEAGNFTSQRLGVILGLKSEYAIRIHGFLMAASFKRCGEGFWTIRLSLPEIRRLFLLEDKYLDKAGPKNIRVRVIHAAVAELNENSDLDVRYKTYLNGRGIGGFDITANFKKGAVRPAQSQDEINIEALRAALSKADCKEFDRELHAAEKQVFMDSLGVTAGYLKEQAVKAVIERYGKKTSRNRKAE